MGPGDGYGLKEIVRIRAVSIVPARRKASRLARIPDAVVREGVASFACTFPGGPRRGITAP